MHREWQTMTSLFFISKRTTAMCDFITVDNSAERKAEILINICYVWTRIWANTHCDNSFFVWLLTRKWSITLEYTSSFSQSKWQESTRSTSTFALAQVDTRVSLRFYISLRSVNYCNEAHRHSTHWSNRIKHRGVIFALGADRISSLRTCENPLMTSVAPTIWEICNGVVFISNGNVFATNTVLINKVDFS